MTDVAVLEPAHDEYGASSAKRWTSCLGSVRLCAKCPPSQDSEWGDEGRVAHDLAELCLREGIRDAAVVSAFKGMEIPAEMHRAVQMYLDHIYDLLDSNPGAVLRVENRVKVPSAVVPNKMGGTYDARVYLPATKTLHIVDYKHGAGIYVSEEDNLQMQVYAIASIFEMVDPVVNVVTTIVQPRSFMAMGAVRSAEYDVATLIAKHAWFEERAYLTLDPNAPLVPTDDNCRWCTAGGYGVCPVAEKTAIAMFDPNAKSMRDIVLPDAKTMSVETMSYLLVNEKLFTAILKNVRMTATGWVKQGNDFPHFKLALGNMEREWYGDKMKIAQTLMIMLNKTLDEVMPRQLITLTEAENQLVDMFRSGIVQRGDETKKAFVGRQNEASQLARETLAMHTLKSPKGGPRLVPLTDPRPALETSVPHLAGHVNLKGLTDG